LAIWNSFAGVAGFGADLKPVQKFTDRKTAIKRIWTAIQKLAEAEATEEQRAAKPKAAQRNQDAAAVPQTSAAAAETTAPKASAAKNAAEPTKPKAQRKAKGGAQAATGAPAKGKATKKATPAKNTPKGQKKVAKAQETTGPREGSKTAQVVAMLQRKGGATLVEIMEKMGWQRHTVRGFMAGAMKKAGYAVESFKPEGGERTYRINAK
jgi:hypothetical protein